MINIVRDIEAIKKPPTLQMSQFDVGFNAGLDSALAIISQYADGEKCICCGSDQIYQCKCLECGFVLG